MDYKHLTPTEARIITIDHEQCINKHGCTPCVLATRQEGQRLPCWKVTNIAAKVLLSVGEFAAIRNVYVGYDRDDNRIYKVTYRDMCIKPSYIRDTFLQAILERDPPVKLINCGSLHALYRKKV